LNRMRSSVDEDNALSSSLRLSATLLLVGQLLYIVVTRFTSMETRTTDGVMAGVGYCARKRLIAASCGVTPSGWYETGGPPLSRGHLDGKLDQIERLARTIRFYARPFGAEVRG
jgi:hypothetical protein